MSYTWRVPKTDWYGHTDTNGVYTGDKFNVEDVVRLSENLYYLRDLAYSYYPNEEIAVFYYDRDYQGQHIFGAWPLRNMISGITPYTGYENLHYYSSPYEYLVSFQENLYALSQLEMLTRYDTLPTVTDIPYGYNDHDQMPLYSGYGWKYNNETMYDIWSETIGNSVRQAYEVQRWAGEGNKLIITRTNAIQPLANQPFYNYESLNTIESLILTVYNRLISYTED